MTWIPVSGDEYPGMEIQQQTIDQVFGGDDPTFLPGVQRMSQAAQAAGMRTA